MEFFEVTKRRRSIRIFESKEIERDKLNQILEAANLAPSAGNLQSYEIILIRDWRKKKKIAEASYNQNFIAQAPIVLIFCANFLRSIRYGERGKLYAIQDATIACAHAHLATTAVGLGSCWVGAFNEHEIKEIINAPEHIKPIAILPIGYGAQKPYKTLRRRLDEIVKEEEL